jgi:hypothetical protein
MARLCVMICRMEDENQPDTFVELARLDLPPLDPKQLQPATTLDQLETQAVTTGQEVMRHLLRHQWEALDQELAAAQQRLSPPEAPAG